MKTFSLQTQALLLLCLSSPSWAAAPLDPAAIAETEQRWNDASRLYHESLKVNPTNAAMWKRLSDLEARRGNALGAAEALEKAAMLTPNDSALALAASQAWAQANKPTEALAACQRANTLNPGQEDILRTCAVQANWKGDATQSALYWNQLLALYAGRPDDRRQYALALGWSGALDDAVRAYRAYLAEVPEDAEMWINYAQVQSWLGNFVAADEALQTYRERFGVTPEYHAARGRMLAWANWTDAASEEISPLLLAQPDDFELNYTQTLIQRNGRRPEEALASLARVQALRPDSRDTYDLTRVTLIPTRSAVTLDGYAYEDADGIRIQRAGLSGIQPLNPRAALLAGVNTEWNHAGADSGYITLDGQGTTRMSSAWLGGSYRFSPVLGMEARLGGVQMDNYGERMIGTLRADIRPDDQFSLVLLATRAPFTPSPLAVSYAVMANQVMAQAYWKPSLGTFVDAYISHTDFSDNNSRNEFYLAPRMAVLRTQEFNLDAGVSGRWMDYDNQINHGYWNPSDYRRYAANLLGYWKISDDDGVALRLSPGWYQDASLSSYKFGSDATLEGSFGIYRDTYAHIALNYSQSSLVTGGYDAWSLMFDLTYRF